MSYKERCVDLTMPEEWYNESTGRGFFMRIMVDDHVPLIALVHTDGNEEIFIPTDLWAEDLSSDVTHQWVYVNTHEKLMAGLSAIGSPLSMITANDFIRGLSEDEIFGEEDEPF